MINHRFSCFSYCFQYGYCCCCYYCNISLQLWYFSGWCCSRVFFFLLVIFAWQANKVKHHFALKKNYFELSKMRLCMYEYKFYTVVVFVVEMCFIFRWKEKIRYYLNLLLMLLFRLLYSSALHLLLNLLLFDKMYVLCNILLAQMRLRIQWYKINFRRTVDGIIGWEYKPIIYILMFLPSAHSYFFLFFSTSDYAIDVFIFALFYELISISSMSNHLK